jgi:glycosyltransferase involved in cell wall biosynthesis
MNIKHVLASIDKSTGGPARSVTALIESIIKVNKRVEVSLETLSSNDPIINFFSSQNGEINFHKKKKTAYLQSLRNNILNHKPQILHGHGLWQMPVHQMAMLARKKKIPYIITPRGMLEPWSLTQGKLKKQIALKLFQYKDLVRANCIHATARMEVDSIRKLGFTNPIAMIPNGISISDFPLTIPKKQKTPKKILFLSRIHVKKGIENLIEAWSLIDFEIRDNWIIEIVGNGDIAYIKSLKELISFKDLQNQIKILPPVFGKDKIELYRESSLFILPTFSENFGIVIAEALTSYTPVITTKAAPWKGLEDYDCGWWIDIGVEPLKKAILNALNSSEERLSLMGVNGRRLIEDNYSMESVAKKMLILYDWVINKTEVPSFVNIIKNK